MDAESMMFGCCMKWAVAQSTSLSQPEEEWDVGSGSEDHCTSNTPLHLPHSHISQVKQIFTVVFDWSLESMISQISDMSDLSEIRDLKYALQDFLYYLQLLSISAC